MFCAFGLAVCVIVVVELMFAALLCVVDGREERDGKKERWADFLLADNET